RGRLLAKAADLLEARLDEFARLETAHNGKTLFESKIELAMTANTLRYYGGWADKITGDTLPVDGPFFCYTLREPVGVVGAIVPWNFPLNIASWKFAPAFAAGCTMVLKPASETLLTALACGRLAAARGEERACPGGRAARRGSEEAHARRSAGQEHAPRRPRLQEATRDRPLVHQEGCRRGRLTGRRRQGRQAQRQGLLRRGD